MSGFVEESHGTEQEPEFDQVPSALGGEIVEGKTIAQISPNLSVHIQTMTPNMTRVSRVNQEV